MSSPRMKIRCPNPHCLKDGTARAELLNRRVSCKHCGHVFRAVPVGDKMAERIATTKVLVPPPTHLAGLANDRVAAIEVEVEVGQIRDQLDRALDALKKAEGSERTLREEVGQLRDQLDRTEHATGGESRDRSLGEELKFLRDQLDKARADVDSEIKKRREVAASLTVRIAEHARAIEAQADEHARTLRNALGELDRVRSEAQAVEARRLASDAARAEAEALQHEEARALRDELDGAKGALEALRLERDRLVADHALALDHVRGQLARLEGRLVDAEATQLDRDRLFEDLDSYRSRLAEADRLALEQKATAAEALRIERDRLEANRAGERAGLLKQLEAARVGQLAVEAALLERDEELEALRSRSVAPDSSDDWNNPSTELEVLDADLDSPTEADIPALRPEASTVFNEAPAGSLAVEAGSLRHELEQARAEVAEAARRNVELFERIRALEEAAPTPVTVASGSAPALDPAVIEAERKRAVDEAVKGAWADFERRLAETQARLRAANARADLMEIEAREAREQALGRERGLDLGDGSSFGEAQSMTSIRILDARGTARLTQADAEARLALAKQLAVDRKDTPLINRIGKLAEKVRADLDARNYTLAETLVRGAEIETGLDPGGFSIAGLRIFRASPTIVASLGALAPSFDRAMRQGDLASIRSTIEEMKTILGDQAGLPEIRRVGRTPAIKRPIAPGDAVRLFLGALEAENWLMRPIAARKSPPDTSLTTYACLIEACSAAREAALEHAADRLGLLDSVIQASCQMLLRRQQPDGHFAFLDPRGRASKLASAIEAMVAQRPDSVKDGWVVLADPLGMAQAETGACALALSTAGKTLGRPEWSQAALKAADWAMGQPCLGNFVANAASAGLLARAYLDAGQDRHLTSLAAKLNLGLLPGQVDNGRWVDAASATTPSHLVILHALHDAWEAIPAGRVDLRGDLKPAIDRAMSSLLAECQALGVPPQGNALRGLLRHRDLPKLEVDSRLEPAILDSATVIQELCHDGPRPKLGVAPDQLAALIRLS